ncbi:50S ribosomal protein L2 [Candidatus Campbellbacteria bacterium]|nr:50S ribosomal protein L2 [Candidatus Campbellbacteria bacterium]|tara:strand:- start:11473 stop:12315 length:843 start_codon:yes stop_codon:yes gene_type:complete
MKKYKPTSPSRRNMVTLDYRNTLTASKPHKALTKGGKRDMGRNNQGRITTRHKGGGNKRKYRMIDFLFNKRDIPAKIETVEYDPNRTAFISLVCYADGERRYVVMPKGVKVGDTFLVGENAPLKPGNRMPLHKIPVGSFIYNIELKPNGGAKLVRSAGAYAQITAHANGYTNIKLPSGEVRKIPDQSYASFGEVSNSDYKLVKGGKAGRSRWRGIRPTVRGSAMNPVDHPHGGGEGRQGIGLRRGPKTRQGKLAYGVKTRRPKKYSNHAIVSRRKTKRFK